MLMILVAVDVVLLMVFGVVRMVLNEHHQQRIQHQHAAAYFAARNLGGTGIEAASRESAH